MANGTLPPETPKAYPSLTVGQNLDVRAKRLREQLLRCMELKAKAEFLGMLDYPADEVREFVLF